jgi:hypothetical protein
MLSSDPERHRGIDGSSGSASTADDDDRVSNAACLYRCESEGGQILRLCASHLRLPD